MQWLGCKRMRRPVLGVLALLVLLLAPAGADAAVHKRFVAGGFHTPVQVVFAPGSAGAYVVEQPGRIIRYANGHKHVFLDIRGLVLFGGEQGLLSAAFPPNYQTSGVFFVYHINNDGDSVVARYRANDARTHAMESTRRRMVRFRQPAGQTNHKGGTLLYRPSGGLYVSLGDGGGSCDPGERAQNPASPLGKIHRLFWNKTQIVALGLRNPFRMSFDSQTGDLWIGDVGQDDFEEIDFMADADFGGAVENFEWDVMEGDSPSGCPNSGYGPGAHVDPVLDYGRGSGSTVIGGYRYRGTNMPAEQGHYFFGDFGSDHVWTVDGPGDSTPDERFNLPNLVSFGEGANHELWGLSINGGLYRIDD
jgi:glucose/arabinose dehydrogenase